MMTETIKNKRYGVLNDPAVAAKRTAEITPDGDLQNQVEWEMVKDLYGKAVASIKEQKYRDGIMNDLRVMALENLPIAGHHGPGVGVNSAYFDWGLLVDMAVHQEKGIPYLACVLEHEYRERFGEEHDDLAKNDPVYGEARLYMRTFLHNRIKDECLSLYRSNPAYRPFTDLLSISGSRPEFASERKKILAFSGELFGKPQTQTFVELEAVFAELQLAGNKEEIWIKVDDAQKSAFAPLAARHTFLKIFNQDQYADRLSQATKKVIKVSFEKDKSMLGELDIAVPKPTEGEVVNAFNVFLAALSRDEDIKNIIQTVSPETLREVLRRAGEKNYSSPAADEYTRKIREYRSSAIAMISA